MNNTELKPCPFCGGEAIKSAFSWGNIYDEYTIQCTVCGARTTVLKSEEATERWNTRKPMDNIVAKLEKAKGGSPITEEDWNYCGAIDEAIDIVRKGGVE